MVSFPSLVLYQRYPPRSVEPPLLIFRQSAYSMDLRERALLDSDAGMKAADVAAKYRVSGSWVRLLKQRRRETGEVAPCVQRHGRRGMLELHLHTLADLIAAHPDRTLAELKDALATPASVPTVAKPRTLLNTTFGVVFSRVRPLPRRSMAP